MDNKYNKIIIILLFVFGIIFTIIGATFAFFSITDASNSGGIGGSTYTFDIDLAVSDVRAGDLIPTVDSLIDTSLAGNYKCVDQRNYGLCSLYKLRFTNNSSAETLVGYLKTVNTTYTTSNLRYRLYDDSYNSVSDIGTVSITANAMNYFKSGANNVSVTIPANSTKDYYLVIWLHDIGENQLEDQNKSYTGSITFTSQNGGTVSSNFITS